MQDFAELMLKAFVSLVTLSQMETLLAIQQPIYLTKEYTLFRSIFSRW